MCCLHRGNFCKRLKTLQKQMVLGKAVNQEAVVLPKKRALNRPLPQTAPVKKKKRHEGQLEQTRPLTPPPNFDLLNSQESLGSMWSPGRFDEQQPITFSQVSLPSSPAVPSVAAGHGGNPLPACILTQTLILTATNTNNLRVADGVALEAVLPPPSPERCNKKESVSAQVTVSSVAARSVEDEVLTTLSTLRNTIEQARQTAMEQLISLVDEDIRWRVQVIGREFKRALTQIWRIEHGMIHPPNLLQPKT